MPVASTTGGGEPLCQEKREATVPRGVVWRLSPCHVPGCGGAGEMGMAPPGAPLVPTMPEGMEDILTASSPTIPDRRERPSCCTCPLGDILPTRGPVTVTERVRSWAAQSPGDG